MVLSEFGIDVGIKCQLLNTQLYNHKCNVQPLQKPCRNSRTHQPLLHAHSHAAVLVLFAHRFSPKEILS